MSALAAMLVALGLDAAIGWPDRLFRRVGHPVTWLGRLISWLDDHMNRPHAGEGMRRAAGIVAALVSIAAAVVPALLVERLLPGGWITVLVIGLLAYPLIAARALHDHVAAVATPLAAGDLEGARRAVSLIVGRDPAQLDDAGVARAALESLAENASDGVVAPVFWGCLLGLPGIAAYKAINTLDSMIGHRTPRHEAFGWAAARIDDVANLVPARLTGLLIAIVSGRAGAGIATMRRDAPRHRSPNAGWPEAAMAAALGVRLSGPRRYAGRIAEEPWVNAEAPDPTAADVVQGLAQYRRAVALLAVIVGMAALTVR